MAALCAAIWVIISQAIASTFPKHVGIGLDSLDNNFTAIAPTSRAELPSPDNSQTDWMDWDCLKTLNKVMCTATSQCRIATPHYSYFDSQRMHRFRSIRLRFTPPPPQSGGSPDSEFTLAFAPAWIRGAPYQLGLAWLCYLSPLRQMLAEAPQLRCAVWALAPPPTCLMAYDICQTASLGGSIVVDAACATWLLISMELDPRYA